MRVLGEQERWVLRWMGRHWYVRYREITPDGRLVRQSRYFGRDGESLDTCVLRALHIAENHTPSPNLTLEAHRVAV